MCYYNMQVDLTHCIKTIKETETMSTKNSQTQSAEQNDASLVTLSVNLRFPIYLKLNNHVNNLNTYDPDRMVKLAQLKAKKTATKRDIIEAALEDYFRKHKI